MEIQLLVINDPSEFSVSALRDRAKVSTKAAFTVHYAAMVEDQEVAFVALDLPDHKRYLCVYELLVDPSQRRRGHGAAVIRKCRELAELEDFENICLKPWPIETGGSEEALRAWYAKLGFVQSPEQRDLMEIVFKRSLDEKIASQVTPYK